MEILRFILFVALTIGLYEVVKSLYADIKITKPDLPKMAKKEDKHTKESFKKNPLFGKPEKETEKPTTAPAPTQDDLTQIDGVTERMLPVLDDAGFHSYTDVEMAELTDLKATVQTSFPQVSDSELKLWRKQASLASQGRWEDLSKLKRAMQKARAAKRIQ